MPSVKQSFQPSFLDRTFAKKSKSWIFLHLLLSSIRFVQRRSRTASHRIPWDNESFAIKQYLKMFADLSSATLKQVANWFVWLASTLGRFFDKRSGKAERNANELRRADHEVHDIADGRYDGRIQKFQQGISR